MGPRLLALASILARRHRAAAGQVLLGGGARLARELGRRRVSVGAWERDLMSLRYDIADMPRGPMREAALAAYATQARAGVHLIASAGRPADVRRQVIAALRAEAAQLARERLSPAERDAALAAVAEARLAAGEPAAAGAR